MARTSTSTTDKPIVYFEFLNDKDIQNVSDSDMDDFLSRIKSNTGKRIVVKSTIKDKVLVSQNTYLAADQVIIKTKKENKDKETEIRELEKKVQESTKKITQWEIEIKTLTETKTTQTAAREELRRKLNDLIEELRILTELLETQTTELKNFKADASIQTSQYYVDQQSQGMFYYTTAPKEFKKEYAINKHADHVNTAYEKCNKDPKNGMPCNSATMNSMSTYKKLRKSFF